MIKKMLAAAAAISLAGLMLTAVLTSAIPAMAAGTLTNISVIPTDNTSGATTDYSINFTSPNAGSANVTIDFSAFGTASNGANLSGVSPTIVDYNCTGVTVNPTSTSVDNDARTITCNDSTIAAAATTTTDH